MAKYRVIRGFKREDNGKMWGVGETVEAESAREAVEKSNECEIDSEKAHTRGYGWLAGSGIIHPVISVYEMLPIPDHYWK